MIILIKFNNLVYFKLYIIKLNYKILKKLLKIYYKIYNINFNKYILLEIKNLSNLLTNK